MARKRTKKQIEQLAREIRKWLDDNFINGDCRIYFNGKCWEHGTEDSPFTWDKASRDYLDTPTRTEWKVIEDIDPKRFFDYAYGFICMSFEGSLYDVLNGWGKRNFRLQDEFNDLLSKHGCYYELGNSWNLSVVDN